MNICSYLDPASLLAQSAVSIRLGRRASNCSHTLLATARRAPLNESNVQGSVKQPSTVASAPTKVLQSVGVDHIGRRNGDADDVAVGRLLPAHLGEPRRRSVKDVTLQIAISGSADCTVEELTPQLHLDAANEGQKDVLGPHQAAPVGAGLQPHGLRRSAPAPAPGLAAGHGTTSPPGPPHVAAVSHTPGHKRSAQHQEQSQRLLPESPALIPVPHAPAHVQHQLEELQPPRLAGPTGGETTRGPTATSVAAAVAGAAVLAPPAAQADADVLSYWPHIDGGLAPEAAIARCSNTDVSSSSASAAASAATHHGGSVVAATDLPPPAPGGRVGTLPPPEGGGDQPPYDGYEGPVGGRWGGGLESELLACRTVHSLQRFMQLMGPRAGPDLMGNAIVHLSHLVAEEPPEGSMERQLLAGLLDDLTQRLRGSVRQLSLGLLTALVCAMSRLRCYDGPLLREAAAAAREAAPELTTRQSGGLMWAYGRYHRDFDFRPESGWCAALLTAALPSLPRTKPTEVAMMLYGCALLREPPPSAALAALLTASLAGMPSACGPELAMSIWSLASLRLHPGREWLGAFLDRCDEATRTFVGGAAVSNVLYGLAAMRVQPPAAWMVNFLWQAQRRMNDMDAQSLVMMGWALGRMRYRPDRTWLTRFFRYTRGAVLLQPRDPVLPGVTTQQLVRGQPSHAALQAATQRQVELWRRQQQRLQRRMHQQREGPWGPVAAGGDSEGTTGARAAGGGGGGMDAAAIPPQAYNVLLWACVRLSCRPMGRWLPLLCAAVQPRLAAWPPHELSALLWGLARLSCRPRDDWMTEFCAAARSSLHLFQPPDCVMTLLAMSRLCSGLGYRAEDGELANSLAARLAPFYPRLQTTTLISMLLALSRVTPRVRPVRLQEALAALLDRVHTIGLATGTATAVAAVGLDAGAAGAEAEAPVQQQQQQQRDGEVLDSTELVPVAQAPASDLSRASSPLPTRSPVPAAAALPPLTARECANAIFAVGCVALWPGYSDSLRSLCGALLRELLPRAFRLMPQMNGLDLVLLVHGVAMSRVRVGNQWLRLHEEQAARKLCAGELQPTQLRDLHRAYHALDYQPGLLPAPTSGLEYAQGDIGDKAAVGSAVPAVGGGDGNPGPQERSQATARAGVVVRLGQSTGLSEAARARRRRGAQGRRRRVTAAIERRVAAAKQHGLTVSAAKGEEVSPQDQLQGQATKQSAGQEGSASGSCSGELEAAERELKQRRALIRRFTATPARRRDAAAGVAEGAAGDGRTGDAMEKLNRRTRQSSPGPRQRPASSTEGTGDGSGADVNTESRVVQSGTAAALASKHGDHIGESAGSANPAVVAGV